VAAATLPPTPREVTVSTSEEPLLPLRRMQKKRLFPLRQEEAPRREPSTLKEVTISTSEESQADATEEAPPSTPRRSTSVRAEQTKKKDHILQS